MSADVLLFLTGYDVIQDGIFQIGGYAASTPMHSSARSEALVSSPLVQARDIGFAVSLERMMKYILLFVALTSCVASCSLQRQDDSEDLSKLNQDQLAFAQSFLRLLDAADYPAAYELTSPRYRRFKEKEQWIAAVRSYRNRAGNLLKRDASGWLSDHEIATIYDNTAVIENITLTSPPHRIDGYKVTATSGLGVARVDGDAPWGVPIRDAATEMMFNAFFNSIAKNDPAGLLEQIELERITTGRARPWHLYSTDESNGRVTLLHAAANYGALDSTMELVTMGSPMDVAGGPLKATPLLMASCKGHLDIAKFLLARGADAAIPATNGMLPLDCARKNSHQEVAHWLEKNNAPSKDANPLSEMLALEQSSGQLIENLCDSISIALRNQDVDPAAMAEVDRVIQQNYFDDTDQCFVVVPDAAVNRVGKIYAELSGNQKRGEVRGSFLTLAAATGNLLIAQKLITAGFKPELATYRYKSSIGREGMGPALLLAAERGDVDMVDLLSKHGLSALSADTGTGESVLDVARDRRIRRILMENGIK